MDTEFPTLKNEWVGLTGLLLISTVHGHQCPFLA